MLPAALSEWIDGVVESHDSEIRNIIIEERGADFKAYLEEDPSIWNHVNKSKDRNLLESLILETILHIHYSVNRVDLTSYSVEILRDFKIALYEKVKCYYQILIKKPDFSNYI